MIFSLLLIIALLRPSLGALDCEIGQIEKNDMCIDCRPGTFRNETTAACQPCPTGTFNPYPRAPDIAVCRLCFEDTFSSSPGSTECTPCPNGSFSGRGATSCLTCGPGYELNPNENECEKCRRGYYSSSISNKQCTKCPDSTFGLEGSTSIRNCNICGSPTEFWVPKTRTCEECPPGSLSKRNKLLCRKCPAGTSVFYGTSNGKFRGFHCRTCPKGTTSNAGSTTCRAAGAPCERGFFENKDGNCEECHPGYFVNMKEKRCEKCQPGGLSIISRSGLRKRCIDCLNISLVPEELRRLCPCPVPRGQFRIQSGRKCRDCPPGNIGGGFGSHTCKQRTCGLGKTSIAGSNICFPCPFGTFTQFPGKPCIPCPEGTVPSFRVRDERRECVRIDTGCPRSNERYWGDCPIRRVRGGY